MLALTLASPAFAVRRSRVLARNCGDRGRARSRTLAHYWRFGSCGSATATELPTPAPLPVGRSEEAWTTMYLRPLAQKVMTCSGVPNEGDGRIANYVDVYDRI